MSGVKRYDAVHLRYEDSNIRYGEGCEVEVVAAYDYARLEQECERLRGLLLDAKTALDPFDDKLLEARIDAALAEINP